MKEMQPVDLAEKAERDKGPGRLYIDIVLRFCMNRVALVSFFILLGIAICAVFAPQIAPFSPYEGDLALYQAKPSPEHPLGCDEIGRDILSRLIHGARISLTVGFIAVAISTSISIVIGLICGYFQGLVDSIVMRVMEMMMAFPGVLLAIILMSAFGRGLQNAILAITIVGIPGGARMVRGLTMAAKESDFIQASRAIGCRTPAILFRHILPNIMAPIIVSATMSISGTILTTAALGFLGLGIQPPAAEWGNMIAFGRNYIFSAPHLVVFPGMAIAVVVLTFNMLGDGLRDALDPRLK
ncbi:MAG: ABC transporter permease [Treponema sp.]|jgi:peptide/nickel transport system permease protein/oligopeptide transport system permease protein|nr:ABC transporter permease [Treponema sp.]